MKNVLRRALQLCLVVGLLSGGSARADDFIAADVKGVGDHPALKRFENSILVFGDKRAYDEFTIALSRVEFDYGAQAFKPWNKLKVEGAHSFNFYRMPKDVSTLEALRNYSNDLAEKGFEKLWEGSGAELDDGYGRFVEQVYGKKPEGTMMEYVFPSAKDFRYLAMQKTNADGSKVYMTGLFSLVPPSWSSKFAHENDVLGRIDVIETKAMGNRMVTVKAEEMAQQIDANGKVALYGILFDFNKTDIKPESEATLAEVAKYLQSQPGVKLLVVGHTDNVGSFESNRDLSSRRAKSVVDYLGAKHSIPAERLFSFGASFAAPVATNSTEEGKAKNRRVELVKW